MSRPLQFTLVMPALLTLCLGCTPPNERAQSGTAGAAHEDLDATLWMQTSGEYFAAAEQAYRTAQGQLDVALDDPNWSADLPQQKTFAGEPPKEPLPPAVILDVDDTVLDNSPYQARLIERSEQYDVETWQQWVDEAAAAAVPGAKAFVEHARQAGVTVLFVTNRQNSVEAATRRNLEQLGLIEPDAEDTILSKYERDTWGSDKSTRRAFIARRYRILLLIGDDLNDFVAVGYKPAPEDRHDLAVEHRQMWGQRWILLPNANYGGWERALYDWDDAAPVAAKLWAKHRHLNTADTPDAGPQADGNLSPPATAP